MSEEDLSTFPELHQTPCPIYLFNAMVQLSHMVESISTPALKDSNSLAQMYTARPDGLLDFDEVQMSIQIAQVGEQEAKLAAWKRTLPEHLQFEAIYEDEECRRQCLMLHLRYLHIRLLVHRQVLSIVVRQGSRKVNMPPPGYLKSVITASVEQCAECASQTVSVITGNQNARAIGPWWYNISRKALTGRKSCTKHRLIHR